MFLCALIASASDTRTAKIHFDEHFPRFWHVKMCFPLRYLFSFLCSSCPIHPPAVCIMRKYRIEISLFNLSAHNSLGSEKARGGCQQFSAPLQQMAALCRWCDGSPARHCSPLPHPTSIAYIRAMDYFIKIQPG